MHPCNHARAFRILVRLVERPADHLVRNQSRLPYYLERKSAALVQLLNNDSGMLRYVLQALIPIEILRAGAEPELVIFSCLKHNIFLLHLKGIIDQMIVDCKCGCGCHGVFFVGWGLS